MNTSHRWIFAAAVAAAQMLGVNLAEAQTVTVTQQGKWTITTTRLPGGSKAHSINELGEVVGEGLTADGLTIRPIWLNGTTVGTLDGVAGRVLSWNSQRHAVGEHVVNTKIYSSVWWTPTASGAFDANGGAYDINESGESAGSARFTTPTIHRRVVTWKSGAILRDLGLPPGAREAVGSGINDRGDVVGNLTDAATGRIEAFVHRNGEFIRLQPLPGPYATYAWDINNNGDIAGTSNGGYPVVWKAGSTTPTVLPVPQGRYPRAVWRINDNGDVVGSTTGLWPVANSAVLWRNGEFIDLGVLPTGSEAYAYDISNAGVIVGTSTTGSPYGWHAVTWTVTGATGGTGADLALTLEGLPSSVRVGQSVSYTTTVTNRGPQTATGATASGSLPSCVVGTLAAGSSRTCVASVTATAVGTLTQTMNASGSSADPVPSNNSASVSTVVTAAGGADLSLTMTDAPDPVRRGATLVYTLVVRNAGPSASDGVTLTDALPSSVSLRSATTSKGACSGSSVVTCAIGSMQPGESATITVTTRARTAGMTVNLASVTATTPDPVTTNNSASTTTTVHR